MGLESIEYEKVSANCRDSGSALFQSAATNCITGTKGDRGSVWPCLTWMIRLSINSYRTLGVGLVESLHTFSPALLLGICCCWVLMVPELSAPSPPDVDDSHVIASALDDILRLKRPSYLDYPGDSAAGHRGREVRVVPHRWRSRNKDEREQGG
jgi:hypothetical protein